MFAIECAFYWLVLPRYFHLQNRYRFRQKLMCFPYTMPREKEGGKKQPLLKMDRRIAFKVKIKTIQKNNSNKHNVLSSMNGFVFWYHMRWWSQMNNGRKIKEKLHSSFNMRKVNEIYETIKQTSMEEVENTNEENESNKSEASSIHLILYINVSCLSQCMLPRFKWLNESHRASVMQSYLCTVACAFSEVVNDQNSNQNNNHKLRLPHWIHFQVNKATKSSSHCTQFFFLRAPTQFYCVMIEASYLVFHVAVVCAIRFKSIFRK